MGRKWAIAKNVLGIVHVLLTSGVVFGWQAILAVFVADDIYGNLCEENEEHPCNSQINKLNLVYTCSIIANYMSNIFLGVLLDKTNPRTTGVISSLIIAAGSMSVWYSNSDAYLLAGFILIGFGGPGIQMATFHQIEYLKDHSEFLFSCSAAAFDGGTMVLFLGKILYPVVPVKTFFLYYTAVPAMTLLSSLFIWDSANPDDRKEKEKPFERFESTLLDPNSQKGLSLKEIITSQRYIFLVLLVSIHIMRLNFVIGVATLQVEDEFTYNQADTLITGLSTFLPFGFVVLPLVAYLLGLENEAVVFQTINIIGIAYGIGFVFINWYYLWVCFLLVAISRQFVYSVVFAKLQLWFGWKHYGTILGISNVVVAAFGTGQYLLVWLHTQYDWSFGSLHFIGMVMVCPLIVWAQLFSIKRQQKFNHFTFHNSPSNPTVLQP